LDRRSFISGCAAVGFTAGLTRRSRAAREAAPHKIVVVGAGIAGLVAANELHQAGHDVQVFEARMRPGGRIHTLRQSFAEGLHAEAGAIDMGDGYTLISSYLKQYDLALVQPPPMPNQVFYARGQRFVVPQGAEPEWPYSLTPEERRLGKAGLWQKYVANHAAKIGDPENAGWPDASALLYDQKNLNDFLLSKGVSKAALPLFHFTLEGDDFDHVSALQSLSGVAFVARSTRAGGIAGGNDRLPNALAAKLGNRIHYGAAMTSIAQDKQKCRITFDQAGAQHELECERVVLAIPFSVLRRVQMDGSFSPVKREVIAGLRYESITSVFLETKRRFWNDQGTAGGALTDLPIGALQEIVQSEQSQGGILVSMTERTMARGVQSMQEQERIRWTLRDVDKVHPGFAKNFTRGMSIVWDEDPWSRGAWSYYAPGEIRKFFPHVARVEGRIHFAGEHTGTDMTLECAARSGHRAAAEIIAAI
jgi:monoamine oxidase